MLTHLINQLLSLYPVLLHVSPSLASLDSAVSASSAPAGVVLFEENQSCQGLPLLLDGEVQVSRRSIEGRSLELYRVQPGELCLVSSSSLFRNTLMSAYGITTKPTTMFLISPLIFQQWLDAPQFRNQVLDLFATRMADLTKLIDVLAFHRLDQRLAKSLLGRGSRLSCTHQELADELGSVREVVTRLLHRFEREGWISLSRGKIQIHQSVALRNFAALSD
ncbi:MAG: Crp/Fnr family transcriptional regulator [Polaromonas sp.]